MTGRKSGVVARAKERNPMMIATHCMLHRQALASKSLSPELQSVLSTVVSVVNHIKCKPQSRLFGQLCRETGAGQDTLLFHSEVVKSLMQDTSTDTEDPDIEGGTEVEQIGTEEPHSSGAMQTEVELQNRATQTYERDFPSQKKSSRSRGTCTLGLKSGSDFGQQTALLTTTIGTSYQPPPIDLDEDSDHSEDQSDDESDDDPDWHFSCEDATTDQDDGDTDDDNTVKKELYPDASPLEDQKFLVYGSCLLKLLAICSVCFATCRVQLKRVIGSMVVFEQLCAHGHSKVWDSQPCYGTMPAGNLQIASAILFGGNSSVKILNLFRYMNIPAISLRTYSLLQTSYLIPAVENVWKRKQQHHLAALKDRPAKLGGDGIRKKLDAKGKRKILNILLMWSKSISHHVYWVASTSQGSKPYKELELIVKSKLLLKDIARLSPAEQTSSLESFHKVILFFAPKSVHFPFTTMAARVHMVVSYRALGTILFL
ncbi:hypothetical protein KUCAC02_027781 [Chaenocephalus aceratus]|nr:hypothetical protein KUCAC02_027781 [Chaenocephalus aceratus]